MTDVVYLRELAWYSFVILTFISGVLWHLCREESDRKFTMFRPLWFLEGDQFSDKGNNYRKGFIVVTGLAFTSLLVWASG